MKKNEYSGMSVQELVKKRGQLAQQLFESKMKNSISQLEKTSSIRHLRREIARINTVLVVKGR